jgi:hypothetical protein
MILFREGVRSGQLDSPVDDDAVSPHCKHSYDESDGSRIQVSRILSQGMPETLVYQHASMNTD